MVLYIVRRTSGRSSSSSSSCCSRSPSSTSCRQAIRRFASPASHRRPSRSPSSGTGSGSTSRGTSSTARFVKNFFVGDEYGWPGLGYSFTSNVSVLSEVRGARATHAASDPGRGHHLARRGRVDRRPLRGQATDGRRPGRDGFRALRHLGAGLLARADGALHLLEEARTGPAAPATCRSPRASPGSSRT